MVLIPDSSPLIALATCDALYLLDLIYEEVKIPLEVYKEVTQENKKYSLELEEYLKDKIVILNDNYGVILDFSLEIGEIKSMMLYNKLHADYLLIDDKRARKIAELNNIKTIGTLGVLYEAKEKKTIDFIRPFIIELYNSDIYISKSVCNYVLKLAGEELI